MPIYQVRGSGEGSMLDGVVQGADASGQLWSLSASGPK
jgi:hypothetical protein